MGERKTEAKEDEEEDDLDADLHRTAEKHADGNSEAVGKHGGSESSRAGLGTVLPPEPLEPNVATCDAEITLEIAGMDHMSEQEEGSEEQSRRGNEDSKSEYEMTESESDEEEALAGHRAELHISVWGVNEKGNPNGYCSH